MLLGRRLSTSKTTIYIKDDYLLKDDGLPNEDDLPSEGALPKRGLSGLAVRPTLLAQR
ncbi:hypothetical protein [Dickeya parazeae]|uniref:hypothetical protein n=1 Tax=Dickeya parazeae TaxID=2893572 RepID=UPI0012FCC5A3|nr:hypothetical protein [Dickeya parazeae]